MAFSEDNTTKLLNKVPEVALVFWIIKIMATTIGETAADYLNFNLGLGLVGTSVVVGALLLGALSAQFRSRGYVPWKYWLTVLLISVFGTLVTDYLVDVAGVSLVTATVVFSAALAATFAVWYAREKTLSIHEITTFKREMYYWAAILFTFALGTAAGDLVSEGLDLGYAVSAMIFALLIVTVTASHYLLRMNATLAFWIAYVLTRPLGASCGDLLSQSAGDGGLGLGTVGTSVFFLATILGLVAYLSLGQNRARAIAEE